MLPPSPSARTGSLLSHGPFLRYLGSRGLSEYSYQIATVAVGWQIYELTRSAFELGMVGLVQFIPSALLVFAAGHAADRYDRRRVAQICQICEGLIAAFLAWGTLAGWLNATKIFAALTLLGITAAFEGTGRISPAARRRAGRHAAASDRRFLRRLSGRGDQRSGARRHRLRRSARYPLPADGDLLAVSRTIERYHQAARRDRSGRRRADI